MHTLLRAQRDRSLDGVRAVAVLLVFLDHHHLCNIGWTGVDLFFVLSGFLITRILRNSRESGAYWRAFWIKRFTRILPPMMILLVACRFLYGTPWQTLLLCLFTGGGALAVFQHLPEYVAVLWSLAVEEHYYLVWPLAVRFCSRRSATALLVGIIVLSPLLRATVVALLHPDWQFIYRLTPFRLDGIALGSLLALLMEREQGVLWLKKASPWGAATAVAAYGLLRIVLGKTFSRDANSVSYNALVYTIVAFAAFFAISYLLTHRGSWIGGLLASRPLVFLGSISYGVYLYQIPVHDLLIRLTHHGERSLAPFSFVLTVVLAYTSFRFIEAPLVSFGKEQALALEPSQTPQVMSLP